MGARPYRYLSLYEPDPGALVEVGSERGEGSTAWLAAYAKRNGLRFYTADIDPRVHKAARQIYRGARQCSGQVLIRRLKRVSIAYLDGFDWIPEGEEHKDWIRAQKHRYRKLGVRLDNDACQQEHLAEAKLVVERAAERCVVICDDTFRKRRGWSGKGGLAVPHLVAQGFEVALDEPAQGSSLGCALLRRSRSAKTMVGKGPSFPRCTVPA